jgi:hypothetical protein
MCRECNPIKTCVGAEERVPSEEGTIFENDSWSNWHPDPQRAFREHDPSLEPYASMSKDELIEAMLDAKGGQEWEFLREFVLDKCGEEERRYDRFLKILVGEGGPDRELFVSLNEISGMATRLIPACPDPGDPGRYDRGLSPSTPRDAPSPGTAT